MPTIRRTVTTATPIGVVYAYLADFANASEWDAGTVSCRRISGDGGVGTRYENVSTFRGRESTLVYEIVELDRDRKLVLRGKNKSIEAVDTMTFESTAAGGTTVTYVAVFTFKGLAKLATPFMGKPLEKLGDDAQRSMTVALARL